MNLITARDDVNQQGSLSDLASVVVEYAAMCWYPLPRTPNSLTQVRVSLLGTQIVRSRDPFHARRRTDGLDSHSNEFLE